MELLKKVKGGEKGDQDRARRNAHISEAGKRASSRKGGPYRLFRAIGED
jgi:hypothetical protein